MKKLLLTFDTSLVSRSDVTEFLNRIDGVTDWVGFLPGAVALDSAVSINALSEQLARRFPKLMFVFSEIDSRHVGGQLPGQVWDFVNVHPSGTMPPAVAPGRKAKALYEDAAAK